jgi:hypothetical protein
VRTNGSVFSLNPHPPFSEPTSMFPLEDYPFYLKDGGSRFLQNIGKYVPDYMASH